MQKVLEETHRDPSEKCKYRLFRFSLNDARKGKEVFVFRIVEIRLAEY